MEENIHYYQKLARVQLEASPLKIPLEVIMT